jgi:hypothetical protein
MKDFFELTSIFGAKIPYKRKLWVVKGVTIISTFLSLVYFAVCIECVTTNSARTLFFLEDANAELMKNIAIVDIVLTILLLPYFVGTFVVLKKTLDLCIDSKLES